MTEAPQNRRTLSILWVALIVLGVILRIAVVLGPGNQLRAPWSGGGDAPRYVLLAQNLVDGRGFTYANQPTALRAPGYPYLLAGFIWLFDGRFIIAARLVQFVLGLGTVFLCSRTSRRAFGEAAGRASFIIGLFFPTLAFVTGEMLTECIGAFLAALFLYLLVGYIQSPRVTALAELGLLTGVAALFRFNMAALGFIGLWVALVVRATTPAWQRVLVFCVMSGIAISPWLIRNQIAFQGQVLYSTLSGHDAIEGVLTPQGRALPGDDDKMKAAEGWILADVETNGPSRLQLPSEAILNRDAWGVARGLWRQWGWRLVPIGLAKLSYFWLGTDQIFWTSSFSLRQRVLRWAGVLVYWLLLALGLKGWLRARRSAPVLAHVLLVYMVILTVLHVPFPMITRLRIPFMDPLIAILGGAARWR